MRNILIAISLTITLAMVGIIGFILEHAALEAWLGTEVFKLTYQFLLIVVIGGAISWLYSQFTKRQEKEDKAREQARAKKAEEKTLQGKFRVGFLQSYNAAKSVRRLLRATARTITEVNGTTTEVIKLSPYDRQMQKLVQVQLQFETLKEEAESEEALFTGVPELQNLQGTLETIEKYLNRIVSEYEDSSKLFHSGDPQPLAEFPRLAEFIGPYESATDFKTEFKKPAKEIVKGILKLLLMPDDRPRQRT
jgi:membrane protein implicated in regulation of membrane protease activity